MGTAILLKAALPLLTLLVGFAFVGVRSAVPVEEVHLHQIPIEQLEVVEGEPAEEGVDPEAE